MRREGSPTGGSTQVNPDLAGVGCDFVRLAGTLIVLRSETATVSSSGIEVLLAGMVIDCRLLIVTISSSGEGCEGCQDCEGGGCEGSEGGGCEGSGGASSEDNPIDERFPGALMPS